MKNQKKTLMLLCATTISLSNVVSPVLANGMKTSSQAKPNLIYIMCDDMTTEAISAYSNRYEGLNITPNLDRLAKQGVVLNNVYAANAICVPSRANILTGLPSEQSGVQTLQNVMNPDFDTYPSIMQENGYETAMVGKWHLQSEPKGYDYYNILEGQGQYGASFDTGYKYKSAPYIDSTKNPVWPEYKLDDPITGPFRYNNPNLDPYAKPNSWPEGHVTKSTMDVAMNWLTGERQGQDPFMLMIHQKAPHVPNSGYGKDEEDFLKGETLPIPETFNDTKETRDIAGKDFGMIRNQNEATYQEDIKGYLRLVKGVDNQVGRLLDYMDQNGNENLKENTVIVFTSDQGLFLGEHHYADKRWINKESARMPFIVSYPKEIKANTKCDDYITNIDFAPTFLDYAGVEKPDYMVGNSFRENLAGNTPEDWQQSAYYRYWANTDANVPSHNGVRNDEYLLIMYNGMSMDILVDKEHINKQTPVGGEFYDLKNDPLQTKNLYYVPEFQEDLKEMKALLEKRKGEVEGYHDILRYPELQERMDAFENGEADIPVEDGTLYAIGNDDLWNSTFNSMESKPANSNDANWGTATQADYDKKNSENKETVRKYTEELKHRSQYGSILQKKGVVDQDDNIITNLQVVKKVRFDLEYKHVYDKHIGDAVVKIQFLDKDNQEVGLMEEKVTFSKVNACNNVEIALDSIPENAISMKIFIDNHGVIDEIGLKKAAIIDETGKGMLPMDYSAIPSEGSTLTINQNNSHLLENWTNKTETVSWDVHVANGLAGEYVVSSKYAADMNTNFTLMNGAESTMETAIRLQNSLYPQNFGTIKLKEGLNTLTLSRNVSGLGNGNGSVKLSDITLSKLDRDAFEPIVIKPDVEKNLLSLDASIRYGNKVFHTGDKLFEWNTLDNGLKWKFHLNGNQFFRIDSEYICGNKDNDPKFTLKIFNPDDGMLIKEIPMVAMDRNKTPGFGTDWDTSSNQILGYLDEKLPEGDYILELGKVNTVNAVVKNVSLVPIDEFDIPEDGVILEQNGAFALSFDDEVASLTQGSTAILNGQDLQDWSSQTDNITWNVKVKHAGKYVISSTAKLNGNTKLTVQNTTSGSTLTAPLVAGSSDVALNLGIIELVEGKNTLVLSKGNATKIELLNALQMKNLDSDAFAAKDITSPLSVQDSILDGTNIALGKDSTFGIVTYQWNEQDDKLKWKVHNETPKSFTINIDYAYQGIQPKYVLEVMDISNKNVITVDMIDKQGTEIGTNLQKYVKQKFGVIDTLPKGDYIVTLKKKPENKAPGRVRSISFE